MILELNGRSLLEVRRDLVRALEATRPKIRRVVPSERVQAIERARLRAKVAGTSVLSAALQKALDLTRRDVLGRLGLRESALREDDSSNADDDFDELFWAMQMRRRFADMHTASLLAILSSDDRRRYQDALEQLDAMTDAERMQFADDAEARGLDAELLTADAQYWASTQDERTGSDPEEPDRTFSAMTPEQRARFEDALKTLGLDESRLAEAFGPAIDAMYEAGMTSAEAELGVSLEMNPERALAALADQTLEFSKTVIDREVDGLRATLAEGIAAGDSAAGIGDRIREYFADGLHYVDESTGAVTRIVPDDTWIQQVARTETTRAHTAGILDAYREAGVAKITWLTTEDDRACDDCSDTDGETITLGDTFDGIDVEAPPAHPSCRCNIISAGFDDDEPEAAA
jgi:SPP1 gp7 family putative phage head morphogenesis protein